MVGLGASHGTDLDQSGLVSDQFGGVGMRACPITRERAMEAVGSSKDPGRTPRSAPGPRLAAQDGRGQCRQPRHVEDLHLAAVDVDQVFLMTLLFFLGLVLLLVWSNDLFIINYSNSEFKSATS